MIVGVGQSSVGELREDLILGQNRNHHKWIIVVLLFQGMQINLIHQNAHWHITNAVGESANGQTPIRNVSKITNPRKKGKLKIKEKRNERRKEPRKEKVKKKGREKNNHKHRRRKWERVGKRKTIFSNVDFRRVIKN